MRQGCIDRLDDVHATVCDRAARPGRQPAGCDHTRDVLALTRLRVYGRCVRLTYRSCRGRASEYAQHTVGLGR